MPKLSELSFEEAIEDWLLTRAEYTKAPNTQFDAELALDKTTLLSFLKSTQPQTYEKLSSIYGSQADEQIIRRIASECDNRGLLDVIRNGIRDRGQELKLAFFKPPTSLNPDTERLYNQNTLTVMRQVYYDMDSRKSIDILLSLNGLPIATVELKNAFTGQTTMNAVRQYLKDRIPTGKTPLIQFKKRALVHFAVDTDEVFMTTRLAGDNTFFLPFNTGDNGGKGNPADHHYETGYKTGYLWEEIWQKDSWLDIIHRFIHLQTEEETDITTGKKKIKETLVFPRYHQLSATRELLQATLQSGPGRDYLIQHSAGSGKTNTISWTAHQLASLHDSENKPVFNSVIVISDRRNLDKQLQDNIYQVEHKHGVVAKIDEDRNSSDLAEELNKGTKIIITTLQKFSFLLGKVKDLSNRKFAVIVDEAHSSQGSKHSGNLKKALGSAAKSEEEALRQAAEEENNLPEEPDIQDLVRKEALSRGRQPNISFYAFTATPKFKTLKAFGEDKENDKPRPFHLYSMRQAIEEGFIHDVLKNYTTFKTYYQLSKAVDEDPEVDKKKAKKAIARFLSLHEYNIARKTEIIVEHFRNFTSKKINGKAKAMLVTSSRLHAVKYKQAIDKYIKEKGYTDIKALVAFSGTVPDPDVENISYTEAKMNGFSEKELPSRFSTPEYQVLVVAEKYQTGFDQPLLHTMFVDKKLADLKAVQTLSRLNRTTSGKFDTFILDFANEIEDIKEAFKPYYEQTYIDEDIDPNILYTLERKVRSAPVIRSEDVEAFAVVYFKPFKEQSRRDHGQFNNLVDQAVKRFRAEYCDYSSGEEKISSEGEEYKSDLQSFVRKYAFLSQIIDWQDIELEKLYVYAGKLLDKLPRRTDSGMIQLDREIELIYYRNDKTFSGNASLQLGDTQPVYGLTDSTPKMADKDLTSPLSEVIKVINERFDTDWTEEDKLLFSQISGDMLKDENLSEKARVNSKEQFRQVFQPEVMKAFVQRHNRNEKIVNDFMSNPEIRDYIMGALLDKVYADARLEI